MRERKDERRNRKQQRGFVLVLMAAASVVLFGCLGLAVDVGRMYVAKNEAQGYADAASLAAALKLDGTSAGVTAAKNAATGMADKWNFMTSNFSGTTVEVATASAGPWTNATSAPSPATNYTYVRVTATAPVTLYFVPVVTAFASSGTPATSSTVNAVAMAAQIPQSTFNLGAFPFSPIAFDGATGGSQTSATNWGFVVGQQYTIRYASDGKSECTGDLTDSNHIKIGSARGYWGDNSASVIAQQVQGNAQEAPITIGEVLPGVGGAKTTVASDLEARVDQDLNTSTDTYATYMAGPHNGRRVVTMPIQSEVDNTILGFGTFFLMDDGAYGHGGNADWCAIFLGQAYVNDNGGGTGASGSPGAYQVKLVQ
jgi:Flp pilus assembly protein TadG